MYAICKSGDEISTGYDTAARGSLSDSLFTYLRDMILTGRIPPGFTFPSENDFCKQLNVGRSTLREAYSGLQSQNLITRTKAGTRVCTLPEFQKDVPFHVSVQQSDIHDVMEFRRMMEEEIAAIAALKATPEQIADLEDNLRKLKDNMDNIVLLSIYDTQFHLGLARISANKLIIDAFELIRGRFEAVVYRAFEKDASVMYRAILFHEKIIDAIRAGEPETARKVMRDHVKNVIDTMAG